MSSMGKQCSQRSLGKIQDIVWDMIIKGLLRPGWSDGTNSQMPFFHVTSKGRHHLARKSRS